MTKFLTKLLIMMLLFAPLPAFASDDEPAEGEESAEPVDPDMNDKTAILPKITFSVLLPKGKRHVIVTAWLQMTTPAWAMRAMELESRITDAIIRDIYPYFYKKGVEGEGLELKKKAPAPAEPITVPTYGAKKSKYDEAIAAYLAKKQAGGSEQELAHKELAKIIQKAANRAIGKDKVLRVTLKQVLQMNK